jgi:two-component system NtrC family sensor kinase
MFMKPADENARCILVVDDAVSLLKATAYVLQGAGYRVIQAETGEEGLRLVREQRPDLVLLDVMLPDIEGTEVLREIRADASLSDVSVLLLSSIKTNSHQQAGAINDGADGYIARPVSGEELLARVATLFRQKDLTEKLRAAESRLQAQVLELERVNQALSSAQMQLLQAEKLSSIGQLAAGVAHEINNPISFVDANLGELRKYTQGLLRLVEAYETLAVDPLNPVRRKAVDFVATDIELSYLRKDLPTLFDETVDGIKRVSGIVRDLKDFSHIDAADWGPADLHAGIDSTLNILRHETRDKVDIIKDYGTLPPVNCAPAQINQVIMNLVVNAVQATPELGIITLRTRCVGDTVLIEVEDTGQGIAPEHLKRVFEPFFTTKPVGQGTGLGLSLSYGIIQRHGGEMSVRSAPGSGATFSIRLPVKGARSTDSVGVQT